MRVDSKSEITTKSTKQNTKFDSTIITIMNDLTGGEVMKEGGTIKEGETEEMLGTTGGNGDCNPGGGGRSDCC
jgi:hypothetical protein